MTALVENEESEFRRWRARALVKLNELDQYDDAELVRKKTTALFADFITRLPPLRKTFSTELGWWIWLKFGIRVPLL